MVCLVDFVNINISNASKIIIRQQLCSLQVYKNFQQACTFVTIKYDFIIFKISYTNLINKRSSCIQYKNKLPVKTEKKFSVKKQFSYDSSQ